MKSTSMLTREEALAARRWFVIDARDQVLGRVASEAAKLLRGKDKPTFTPHVDCGDFVVIVNAEQRQAHRAARTRPRSTTGTAAIPGGIRDADGGPKLRAAHPERLLRLAVTGMLPKNRLGRQLATKLKIYAGAEHPHAAQQPVAIELPAAGSRGVQPWPNERGITPPPASARPRSRASVSLPGDGKITVNRRTLEDYFGRPTSRMIVNQPLELTGTKGQYDVVVNVVGGGIVGAGVGDPPRHHPRADRGQPRVPPGAEEGRATSRATRARSSARSTAATRRASVRSTRSARAAERGRSLARTGRATAPEQQEDALAAHAATSGGNAPLWPSEVRQAEQHPVAEADRRAQADDGRDARMAAQPSGDRHRDQRQHQARERQRQLQVQIDQVVRGVDALARQVSMRSRSAREAELLRLALHFEEVVERLGDRAARRPVRVSRAKAVAVEHRCSTASVTCQRPSLQSRARHVHDAAQVEVRRRGGRW